MASQLFSSWRFYFTASQPDSPIVGASDIGHEYTGLKQATGPRNRTRDLQNDRAVKSGVRTLDLQQHRVHEEHETYTDRARNIQIAGTTSTWNASIGRRTTARPFEFSEFSEDSQILKNNKKDAMRLFVRSFVPPNLGHNQDQDLQVCTCGKHTTEMVYHGKYMIIVDFHFHFCRKLSS